MSDHLALAIDLQGVPCLVVGGGNVGTRKALTLLSAGACVTVMAPVISPELHALGESRRLRWLPERFAAGMIDGQRLVVAATNDKSLNRRIARAAERRGILCCNASSAGDSRVIFSATCSAGGITVAVHSDGRDCRRSQEIRDRLAAWLVRAVRRKTP